MAVWFKRFTEPIVLDDGRVLHTLRDAADYITKLPKAESDLPEWQVAMQTLLLVAERDGPELMARIAMMKALFNDEPPPAPEPRRKAAKKFRVIR